MSSTVINMDDPKMRAKVANRIQQLRGRYRFEVTKYRPRRSDRQNRYYWPCFVQPFAEFLRDQGEDITNEQAHEILKYKFLQRERIDKGTGEVMTYTESTTRLDTAEFNEYLDRCAYWLADMFNIVVPDPADYHERN